MKKYGKKKVTKPVYIIFTVYPWFLLYEFDVTAYESMWREARSSNPQIHYLTLLYIHFLQKDIK